MPAILEMEHIGGDLHVHTDWSDGQDSIADMARVARKLKYNFVGIIDHFAVLGIAHGLDVARLQQQLEEVKMENILKVCIF